MKIHLYALTILALFCVFASGTYETERHSYQENEWKARQWDQMQWLVVKTGDLKGMDLK